MLVLKKLSKLKEHRNFRVISEIIIVGLIYIFGQISVSILLKGFSVDSEQELLIKPGVLTSAYIVGGTAILLALAVILKLTKTKLSELKLGRPKLKDIGYGFLGFGAYFIIVRILLALIVLVFPSFNADQAQNIGLQNASSNLLPIIFFALAVVPPISEELLFRGYLYNKLIKNKISVLTSALIVSVIFGALHGQWNVAIDTFTLSMVMIYVLQLRPSLWATITMHFLKNSLAFLVLFIFRIG